MGLFSELRRRNVLRMAALYMVTAWLVMQVAEVLMGLAALPEWMGRAVLGVLAIGFPIALVLAWFYEVTPEGVKRESQADEGGAIAQVSGRRMDFVIIAVLAAAVVLFAYDKWWVGAPPEKSIAVLAFENMSGDPAQEYFSDGISEEILNLLAQMPGLTVISRSSAFSFKGKNTPIPEVAAQLNVAHVLEGSVRRAGDRVRITAQLIEASSDSHRWSQSFDRDLDDIFAVQDEIAAAISEVLKLRLAGVPGGTALPAAIATASPAAYDAYLKGRELIAHRTKGELLEAIGHLERSISLDNSYAPAHAQLAIATLLSRGYGNEEGRRIAALHLERAQELEPDLAEAHGGRALLALNEDAEAAIVEARRALRSNPNYVDAMVWLRQALERLGRPEEADSVLETMLVTDPLSIIARTHYVGWLIERGRFEEAHQLADRIMAQDPRAGYRAHAAISYWGEGQLTTTLYWGLKGQNGLFMLLPLICVGEFDEARRVSPGDSTADLLEGHLEEAIGRAKRHAELNPNSGYILADSAEVLYQAGRMDEALVLYERAHDLTPGGQLIAVWGPKYAIQLAVVRRTAGNEQGARQIAQLAKEYLAVSRRAGDDSMIAVALEAMIAAFDHQTDDALAALGSALHKGARWPLFFDDPVFADLREEPRFVAYRRELDDILAEEHDKILQLICFNNPAPEQWQPLPETCEGVVEREAL